jgi:hypothetical protein
MMHKEQPKRPCAWCDRVFRPLSQTGLYCTLGCREAARLDRMGKRPSAAWASEQRTCTRCSKVFAPHHQAAQICLECKPRKSRRADA